MKTPEKSKIYNLLEMFSSSPTLRYLQTAGETGSKLCKISLITKHQTNMARCNHVMENCSTLPQYLNIFKIHYCWFDESWLLTLCMIVKKIFKLKKFILKFLINFFLKVIVFRFQVKLLDYVSDGYISTAIAKISNYLRLSQAIAGVTLLAFANGVTDIITVVVASLEGEQTEGDNLAIGDLLGASFFGFTFVLAYIIFNSNARIIRGVYYSLFANFFNLVKRSEFHEKYSGIYNSPLNIPRLGFLHHRVLAYLSYPVIDLHWVFKNGLCG